MFSSRLVVVAAALLVCCRSAQASAARDDVPVTFRFEPDAAAVVRVSIFDTASNLTQADLSQTLAVANSPGRPNAQIVLTGPSGRDVVVRFDRSDGSYYLDGPFRWPTVAVSRDVQTVKRRTVEGPWPTGARSDVPPTWIDRTGSRSIEIWPRCHRAGRTWSCVGVSDDESGVLAFEADRIAFAVVRPAQEAAADGKIMGAVVQPVVHTAAWASLVVLEASEKERLQNSRVQLLQPSVSRGRSDGERVTLTRADGTTTEPLGQGAYVVAGNVPQDNLMLQVDGEEVATKRVALEGVALTLLSPLRVELTASLAVQGRVETASGRPANGTRLLVSELIEVKDARGRARILRRSLTDSEVGYGAEFELMRLGPAKYELLAINARLGRATVMFEPDGRPLIVRLDAPALVTGRVVRQGAPVPWAWVDVPPEHSAYLKAADPLEVLALATFTGNDGRFELALPPAGITGIRISGETNPGEKGVTRTTVPAVAPGATLDLGDIELPSAIAVAVTYVGEELGGEQIGGEQIGGEHCVLVAAGPVDHSGRHLIEADVIAPGSRRLTLPEPGRWMLGLRCGSRKVPVEPPMLDVPPGVSTWSAHVVSKPR